MFCWYSFQTIIIIIIIIIVIPVNILRLESEKNYGIKQLAGKVARPNKTLLPLEQLLPKPDLPNRVPFHKDVPP